MRCWLPRFFTFGRYTIPQAKAYLRDRGVPVRLDQADWSRCNVNGTIAEH